MLFFGAKSALVLIFTLLECLPAMNSTYGNATDVKYTSGLPGPWRLKYPTEKLNNNELLSSLTKVLFIGQ